MNRTKDPYIIIPAHDLTAFRTVTAWPTDVRADRPNRCSGIGRAAVITLSRTTVTIPVP